MSPEQASGDLERVGPASDVYGLGATLYCLLVGTCPVSRRRALGRPRPGAARHLPGPAQSSPHHRPGARGDLPEGHGAAARGSPRVGAGPGGEIEAWLADVRYRGEQVQALNQVKGSLCRLCIERAQNLFGRGGATKGCSGWPGPSRTCRPMRPGSRAWSASSLGSWYARDEAAGAVAAPRRRGSAVAFSPDGHRLATACADALRADLGRGDGPARWARVWGMTDPSWRWRSAPTARGWQQRAKTACCGSGDALTGKPVGKPIGHGMPIRAVRFSPDGTMIATACRTRVPCLWRTATGQPVESAGSASDCLVSALAFDPLATLLAAACEEAACSAGRRRRGTCTASRSAHPGPVTSLAFHADGQTLLTGCRDGKARLWDLAPGRSCANSPCRPPWTGWSSSVRQGDGHRLRDGRGAALGPRDGQPDRRTAGARSRRSNAWPSVPTGPSWRPAAATGP